MEFVFQLLADLLSPVDEKQVKAEQEKIAQEPVKTTLKEEIREEEARETNIFGVMDFH
ncbi:MULTISPECIES: hypothetical protein [unclassified Carboxylicivirga]|uniref:hypothetical protein n=1 Tax=Carboxylicivirga TaxID=1628153 RepID=UPI003D34BDE2